VILMAVLLFVLILVVYQVFVFMHISPSSDESKNLNKVSQVSCLDTFSKLIFVNEDSCKGGSSVKVKIQNNGLGIKGMVFFDGQNLIHKSYDSGEVYEFDYNGEISSFGYSAIIDEEGEDVICGINGGYSLRTC